jgi:hypothetical protein
MFNGVGYAAMEIGGTRLVIHCRPFALGLNRNPPTLNPSRFIQFEML